MSIHEEATIAGQGPMMGVFNNLVMYDQQRAAKRAEVDRARSGDELVVGRGGTELTFQLRQGVKWHDGKPFTAPTSNAPGTCCWARQARSCASIRARPGTATSTRSSPTAIYEVTFHLKRPQPAFIALLASGFSPVYPCHVPPAEMRQHPIGTGPFKFVEFKPNEIIRVARNPDYWKPGRPYLDGIE